MICVHLAAVIGSPTVCVVWLPAGALLDSYNVIVEAGDTRLAGGSSDDGQDGGSSDDVVEDLPDDNGGEGTSDGGGRYDPLSCIFLERRIGGGGGKRGGGCYLVLLLSCLLSPCFASFLRCFLIAHRSSNQVGPIDHDCCRAEATRQLCHRRLMCRPGWVAVVRVLK